MAAITIQRKARSFMNLSGIGNRPKQRLGGDENKFLCRVESGHRAFEGKVGDIC